MGDKGQPLSQKNLAHSIRIEPILENHALAPQIDVRGKLFQRIQDFNPGNDSTAGVQIESAPTRSSHTEHVATSSQHVIVTKSMARGEAPMIVTSH